MVNTHVHGDHTGGNENFGKMGVTIIAREQLRNRLLHPNPAANGQPTPPTMAIGLPLITFNGALTMHMNGEDIQLIGIPAAHTDGDTMVYFPGPDVIMTGDFYRSIQYPNIDRANGGSLNGMINGLGRIIGIAGPDTKIVPGHGPIVRRDAVMAHRDVILGVRDKISKMVQQGKSQEEVAAAKPQAEYDARIKEIATTGERFVGQVYMELKGAR
jgi:glyoxylase-like metal-dependent hydrolase (beta-lactamase superfamily II)